MITAYLAHLAYTIWPHLAPSGPIWPHLAPFGTIWPDRVREVCRKDRSIAIAPGLEDFCEVGSMQKAEGEKGRRKRKASTTED